VVITVATAGLDNGTHLDNLTSKVGLEKPEIGSTDHNIPTENNSKDDELHVSIPGVSGYDEEERDKSDKREAIPTASWRQQLPAELKRFDLQTSDVDGSEGESSDRGHQEDEASQAEDGLTVDLEDWPQNQ
jgi:hypothetical protein